MAAIAEERNPVHQFPDKKEISELLETSFFDINHDPLFQLKIKVAEIAIEHFANAKYYPEIFDDFRSRINGELSPCDLKELNNLTKLVQKILMPVYQFPDEILLSIWLQKNLQDLFVTKLIEAASPYLDGSEQASKPPARDTTSSKLQENLQESLKDPLIKATTTYFAGKEFYPEIFDDFRSNKELKKLFHEFDSDEKLNQWVDGVREDLISLKTYQKRLSNSSLHSLISQIRRSLNSKSKNYKN